MKRVVVIGNGMVGRSAETGRSMTWVDVCALDDIVPTTGVCALIGDLQIAVVRVGEGTDVYAVGNRDPFSDAYVISRGLVGDKGGIPKIASPIYKQSFDLRSGACLDDPNVRLPAWPARVEGGRVLVDVGESPIA